MTDFATARRHMVDGQVRTADVTDLRIINAMIEIPREQFVPTGSTDLAYLDLDLQKSRWEERFLCGNKPENASFAMRLSCDCRGASAPI